MIRLKTDYYQQFDADHTRDVPAEAYGGWKTGEVEIDPRHTALIVMHAWDCGTPEEYPGWFRSCACISRTYDVCRAVFPRLLPAVRRSELTLFHVVAGSTYCKDHPGYQHALALSQPPPPPLARAEPDPVYERLQRFRSEHVFVGKHNQDDASRGWAKVKFAKEAEPQGHEGIAENAHQLYALCREAGINHLIYTGFNIDWCLLMSEGGMVDMSRRGFICSTIRQAVTAVENKESARRELSKENSLWRVSVGFGFVFDLEDFIASIAAPK